MILPTKHLPESQSLLGVGGTILALLSEREATVSSLWDEFRRARKDMGVVSFDWFILGLDLLFALGAVELDRGVLRRREVA
jgi:hypothetical protein